MMIEFEDRQPAPPMSIGGRIAMSVLMVPMIYCSVAPFITIGRWVASLFS